MTYCQSAGPARDSSRLGVWDYLLSLDEPSDEELEAIENEETQNESEEE